MPFSLTPPFPSAEPHTRPVGRLLALAAAAAGLTLGPIAPAAPATARIEVDAAHPGPKVSPTLYGIFFEEINCSGDGGLYAELVRNRSFEDGEKPEHWTGVEEGGCRADLAIDTDHPMSAQNRRSLRVTITGSGGRAGVANEGYWGIPLEAGAAYDLSLNARAATGFEGSLTVSLVGPEGTVLARETFKGLTGEWAAFKATLKAAESCPKARLVIASSQPGVFWLDVVSLFPQKTWKGRANGLRPDLAGLLDGLHPAFMRFPGGCWVEGDTLSLSYHWKQTIGQTSDRRNQYNIWQYYSTHGLGYHEYLQLCEDLKAEPLFVINCGMSHKENVPMDQLGPWVQDALDAIEYANGPATSQWGAERAKHGHPAPFHLGYMEIGNENGGAAYRERYAVFYRAIKEKYPEMHLVADDWGGAPSGTPVDILDEHYYSSPGFFIKNSGKYDTYPRTGHKVYVGEYAVTEGCGAGNLKAALGEAAFMTGMERNSDVVVLASYAPLFANLNYKKWNPDLINFDNGKSYGTPSYYVQQLFSENRGDTVLPAKIELTETPQEAPHGAVGVATWDTRAEYKDLKVTQEGRTLYEFDPAAGTKPFRLREGKWGLADGALQQTAMGNDHRAVIGDAGWGDYTLSLKARKISGAEGFLILFHVQDDNNWLWWNLGGWGNSRHAIEQCNNGGKNTLGGDHAGRIETGRWYDIRIEVRGTNVRCFLDGEKIHDVNDVRIEKPLHVVAGRSDRTGEVILKLVNVAKTDYDAEISLAGVGKVASEAALTVLTSGDPADENSLATPRKVAPVAGKITNADRRFHHTLPANSLTILRLKAE